MFTRLRFIAKCSQLPLNSLKSLTAKISTTAPRFVDKPLSPIVDINVDTMMYEDPELACLYRDGHEEDVNAPLNLVNSDGTPLAPVDIDAWENPEEAKQGTVEIESYEKKEFPPIPEDRSGKYEFKGIKVILPKRMLKPETYRYRLDKEDQETRPDDIRVCTFEK